MPNPWRRHFMVAVFCGALCYPVLADPYKRFDLELATKDNSDTTRLIVTHLKKSFPHIVENKPAIPSKKRRVIVAVGPAAVRALLADNQGATIVAMFTSSIALNDLLNDFPKQRHAITAIYADPSLAEQLKLIGLLYKRRVTVGTTLSDKTLYLEPMLHKDFNTAQQELLTASTVNDGIAAALNQLKDAHVLLALPDDSIYNADTIRNILLTSYRRNQALVGFSASMVKAGALATTYSSIDDAIAQLEELLTEYDTTGRLPAAQYPKYFSVVINDTVAKSLNLVVDDKVRQHHAQPEQAGKP